MNAENTVAKVLKVYAIINAAAGVLLGIIIGASLESFLYCIMIAGVVAVASFGIYAVGEAIQLLHDIKLNTSAQTLPAEKKTLLQDIEANLPEM